MRGTVVSSLLTMLKAEVGYSLDASATGKDAALIQLLCNKQKWLVGEYDFPFLEHRWNLSCAPGSRYLTIPAADVLGQSININFERPAKVEVFYNNKWLDIDYGIGSDEYNYLNSDDPTQVLDPIQKWRFATDSTEVASPNYVEIWPLPVTAQTLRFTAQRDLQQLNALTDKADLDDTLLVAFTAVGLVPAKERPEKMQVAQDRLRRVLGGYPRRAHRLIYGRGGNHGFEEKRVRTVTVVAVHG